MKKNEKMKKLRCPRRQLLRRPPHQAAQGHPQGPHAAAHRCRHPWPRQAAGERGRPQARVAAPLCDRRVRQGEFFCCCFLSLYSSRASFLPFFLCLFLGVSLLFTQACCGSPRLFAASCIDLFFLSLSFSRTFSFPLSLSAKNKKNKKRKKHSGPRQRRDALRRPGGLQAHPARQAGDDVLGHARQGGPPDLQKVHDRREY